MGPTFQTPARRRGYLRKYRRNRTYPKLRKHFLGYAERLYRKGSLSLIE